MKEFKQNFKTITKDRPIFFLMLVTFVLGIIFFISTISGVEAFDRLIYARYTVFGGEHFYRDIWQFRIILAILGLIIAIVHNLIIAKLRTIFGRRIAVFYAIMGIFIAIISMMIVGNIFREIQN
jgi:hypothetical protein